MGDEPGGNDLLWEMGGGWRMWGRERWVEGILVTKKKLLVKVEKMGLCLYMMPGQLYYAGHHEYAIGCHMML